MKSYNEFLESKRELKSRGGANLRGAELQGANLRGAIPGSEK